MHVCKGNFIWSKKQNSDEFLVKKENPLVLPPNFDDLPEPQKKIMKTKIKV